MSALLSAFVFVALVGAAVGFMLWTKDPVGGVAAIVLAAGIATWAQERIEAWNTRKEPPNK